MYDIKTIRSHDSAKIRIAPGKSNLLIYELRYFKL